MPNGLLEMTESSYIDVVQWTGEQVRSDKRGALKPLSENSRTAPADIRKAGQSPEPVDPPGPGY